MDENVNVTNATPKVSAGSVGLSTQVNGEATTASAAALATGGVSAGNLIQSDIDEQL